MDYISKNCRVNQHIGSNRIGICTKTQCPSQIIGRCSLCPYFITNYMFIQEIGLEMQLSMARSKKNIVK